MSELKIKTEQPDEDNREQVELNNFIMPLTPTLRLRSNQYENNAQRTCFQKNLFSQRNATRIACQQSLLCGELFVTKNARRWTFVCTYCKKKTRDIGNFICHIHHHLQQFERLEEDQGNVHSELYSDEAMSIDADDDCEENSDYNIHGQEDFMDCGNYLDVNMDTESEDVNYIMQEKSQPNNKRVRRSGRQPKETSVHITEDNNKKKSITNFRKAIVNLVDENEVLKQNESSGSASSSGCKTPNKKCEPAMETVLEKKKQEFILNKKMESLQNGTPESLGTLKNDKKIDKQFVTENDEPDEAINFESRHSVFDQENDEDFDNQLLLVPGSEELSDNNMEIKTKRRQIRGTAYCVLCNKTFQYYSLYRNHMIKHSDETPFHCVLCKKGFKSKQAIRYHMNTHQKDKKFKCSICQTGFYTENQFITHILTHENADTFPCMVCGKIFQNDNEREHHLTAHTEERPFRCEFCNKRFRLRHHLSNHLKMHRQYRCDYCKDEFTSAVHLRKPYACPTCEKRPEIRDHVEANRTLAAAASTTSTLPEDNGNGRGNSAGDPFELLGPMEPSERIKLRRSQSSIEENSIGSIDEADDQEGDETYMDENDEMTLPTKSRKKRLSCKYCPRSYSHVSGLNYHIRNKHCQ